jgi:hypothetical protein
MRDAQQPLAPPKVLCSVLCVVLLASNGADDAEGEVDGGEDDVVRGGEGVFERPGPDLLVFEDEGGPVEDREGYR